MNDSSCFIFIALSVLKCIFAGKVATDLHFKRVYKVQKLTLFTKTHCY